MLAATQGASPFPRRTLNAGIATARLLGPHVLLEGRATDGVADSAVPQIRENVTRGPTPVKRFRAPFERSDHQNATASSVVKMTALAARPRPYCRLSQVSGRLLRCSHANPSWERRIEVRLQRSHTTNQEKARHASKRHLSPLFLLSAQKIAEKFKPVPSTVAAVWSQLPMTRPPSTLTAWPVM